MIDDVSMDTKLDDFAKSHGPTQGTTDTVAYRDAMDAFKKYLERGRICFLLDEDHNCYASFKYRNGKVNGLTSFRRYL